MTHLVPLPQQLRALDPPVDPRVLAIVDAEHGRWRQLHDRLVALIVQLLDIAADDRPVDEVIARLIGETTVGIDDLVGSTVDAVEIAALLRAHGSVGTVAVDGDVTDVPARLRQRRPVLAGQPGRREGRRRRGARRSGWAAAVLRAVRAGDHGPRRRRVDRRAACRAGRAVHVAGAVTPPRAHFAPFR